MPASPSPAESQPRPPFASFPLHPHLTPDKRGQLSAPTINIVFVFRNSNIMNGLLVCRNTILVLLLSNVNRKPNSKLF